MSDLLWERIKRLSNLVADRGVAESFDLAVDQIMEMLRMAPRESGDPLRKLRGLAMIHYRIYHGNLIADYSVHERIRWSFCGRSFPAQAILSPPLPNGQ